MRAVNATGIGVASDASTAVAPKDETLAGSAVEATTATLTISNYTGSWYYKYTTPNGGSCVSDAVTATSADVADLSGNTSYTFKAYSNSGCTTLLATALPFLTKPGKPAKPSAAAGAGTGKLTITATMSGNGAVTGWAYQQKEGSNNYGSWTDITSTSTSLSYTVSGLDNSKTYQFKVRAKNATGTGAASDASDAASPSDRTLAGSSVEATTATLTIGGYTGNWYYKANVAPDTTCKGPVASGTATRNLTGLSGNTSYTYVAYSDSSCTTANQLATATLLTKPGTPTTPTVATNIGSGKLTITASVTGSGTLSKWQVQQKASTDNNYGSWQDVSSTATNLTHTVTGLTDGTSYQFKVRAVNATGDGVTSNASGAKAPALPELALNRATSTSATLTLLSDHTGDWWWTKDNDATTCSNTGVSGTTLTLSGLTEETSYIIAAYGQAQCNGTAIASVTFRTPSTPVPLTVSEDTLTASTVEATTATLTIGNYSGNWYYKATAPSDGTCSTDAVSGTSVGLTGLSGNTSYIYKAYSDSGCTNANELAVTSAFLTKPGQPTTFTVSGGSGKLTLTASLTGDGAISKWQLQQKASTASDFGGWTDIASTVTNLTHTVTGLSENTSYQFKVRAVNATGSGEASDASTAVLPTDETLAASAIEATTATLTVANYSGSWYYKATAPSGGTCSTDAVSGTSTTLTGLSGNTSYTFKAYSDSSCTDANELAVADPFLTKPGQPTTPTVAAGAGSGKLTLSASLTGSGAISKWQVQQKANTASTFGGWSDVASTATSLTHTITGLSDGTSYQFKVRAVNATGNGAESGASTAVAPTDEMLTSSNVEANTATLTIANHSGSWYYKATAPSGGSCSAEIAAGTATADLTGLSTNTSYTYTAYSDSGCTTELAVADAFLTKPGQPTKPMVAAGAGSGQLTLSASLTGDGAISKWQVQQKASTASNFGAWQDIASATTTNLTHTVTGLSDDTSYQFKVRAVNATGNGAESGGSTAVAPTDETLAASEIEATTATLTIANYSGSWHYKATAPSGGTCSSEIAANTTTATVSSLAGNTAYTFKAYSDSRCTDANELAVTDPFLTKPGQPTTLLVAAGAGSGKLTLSASVTGRWRHHQAGNFSRRPRQRQHFRFGWNDIASISTNNAQPHPYRPHRRHELPVQGARRQRLPAHGAESRMPPPPWHQPTRSLTASDGRGDDGDTHHRQLQRQLAL